MSHTTSKVQNANAVRPSANPSADYAAAHTPVWSQARTGEASRRESAPPPEAQPVPTGDRTKPLKALAMVGGFIVLMLYGTIAFTSGDLLWFIKRFDTSPAHIVVYHDGGARAELSPGDPDFAPLAQAIQICISQGLERPSGIGFSDASLLDAYTRYVSVEAYFDQPVKLHAWFNTEEPTRMLFPITGRHSELSLVVLGKNGKYLASPPVLKTIEPLREALRELGYY
jgi:hypothetical protein